jgi:hypothetical protein
LEISFHKVLNDLLIANSVGYQPAISREVFERVKLNISKLFNNIDHLVKQAQNQPQLNKAYGKQGNFKGFIVKNSPQNNYYQNRGGRGGYAKSLNTYNNRGRYYSSSEYYNYDKFSKYQQSEERSMNMRMRQGDQDYYDRMTNYSENQNRLHKQPGFRGRFFGSRGGHYTKCKYY